MSYRSRVVDAEVSRRLQSTGALVIEGPKGCGKTSTARRHAASEVLLDTDVNAKRAALIDPMLVLDGRTPRLIDEWQVAPGVWNAVRRAIDDRGDHGQFLLTGSAVPADDHVRHTGAGRFAHLRMRPMSLYELGQSTATVSLRALLNGEFASCQNPGLTLGDLIDLTVTGGWPRNIGLTPLQATAQLRDYLVTISRTDVRRLDDTMRRPRRVMKLMQVLARHVATDVKNSTLEADWSDETNISRNTIADYLGALDRVMVIEDQPPWAPHLRGKARVRQAPKRHFVDPSLAVAAARATPAKLLKDLAYFGTLFESLVVRDLRIHAQAAEASVYHYRDNSDLEVDAVVDADDGCWAAFEVKLGQHEVEKAAATLLRFANKIDTTKTGKPGMLAVITGMGYGYRRPDGVAVIPVGALAP